jgi:anti-sigma regulatory factor (Ser/Thr protein kinase)
MNSKQNKVKIDLVEKLENVLTHAFRKFCTNKKQVIFYLYKASTQR